MDISMHGELVRHIANRPVEWIKLRLVIGYNDDTGRDLYYTVQGTLEFILAQQDRKYDHGYGTQALFGVIWYADGSWSERCEYGGSEWWRYMKCPSRNEDV